jgi:hypothetical protein
LTERKVAETEQRLGQTGERLQQLSNQVHEKQQAYDEQHGRHTQLTADVEQRQAAKEHLEKRAQDTHLQWTSKQIWVTSAAKNVAHLHNNIGEIKLNSRQAAEATQQQQQKRSDVLLHKRNDAHNSRQRREEQRKMHRK